MSKVGTGELRCCRPGALRKDEAPRPAALVPSRDGRERSGRAHRCSFLRGEGPGLAAARGGLQALGTQDSARPDGLAYGMFFP